MLPQQTHRDNSLPSYSRPNNFNFQPRTEREKFRTREVHTAPEQLVYDVMYLRSEKCTKIKQYTNEEIRKKAGYKDARTISRAIRGLLDKEHIELVSNAGRSHHGTAYRVKSKYEIFDLRQTSEYQERQAGKSRAKKALTVLMVLNLIKLIRQAKKGQFPAPDLMAVPASDAPTAPVEYPEKISSVPASNAGTRVHQMHPQENFILIHEFREPIENHSGGDLVTSHARGDGNGAERQEDEKAASRSGNSRREVPSQSLSRQTKKEVAQKTDCDFRTTPDKHAALRKALIKFLGLEEIVPDEYTKGTIRRGIAWCVRNGICAEQLTEYNLWWWKEGKIKPPKLDWLIETYPVFRGDLRRQQTGTPAAAPDNSRVAQRFENPQEPAEERWKVTHSAFWQSCLEKIKPLITEGSFDTWFASINAEQKASGVVIFAPDPVFRDWLQGNFAEVLSAVGLGKCRWDFTGGVQ